MLAPWNDSRADYMFSSMSYHHIAKVICAITGKKQSSLLKTEGRDTPYFDRSVLTDHMEYIWSEIDYGTGVDIVKGIATVNATGNILIASVPYQEGDLDTTQTISSKKNETAHATARTTTWSEDSEGAKEDPQQTGFL